MLHLCVGEAHVNCNKASRGLLVLCVSLWGLVQGGGAVCFYRRVCLGPLIGLTACHCREWCVVSPPDFIMPLMVGFERELGVRIAL